MKKKRLFIRNDSITDGQWWYCGGPDDKDAAHGVANQIEAAIGIAMHDGSDLDDLEFDIREMTDEEVAALPEL